MSARAILRMAAFGALVALAACDVPPPPPPAPLEPEAAEAPIPQETPLGRYYQSVQAKLLAQGLLRTDGGGPDTPFGPRDLARNFERIALYDEYQLENGRFVQRETKSTLRRWEKPVRIVPIFGRSVPEDQRLQDADNLRSYARRLSDLTRHPISVASAGGNYFVLFLTADELAASGATLRSLLPGIDSATVAEITRLPRTTYCSVYAFSDPGSGGAYSAAVAIIRAEHPDLLRLSCIHEEIAQGLGLANDSPRARPSIFNDDEEFALLTRMDELMLRILYDRRLRVGMTPDEARPIVERIAAELLGATG